MAVPRREGCVTDEGFRPSVGPPLPPALPSRSPAHKTTKRSSTQQTAAPGSRPPNTIGPCEFSHRARRSTKASPTPATLGDLSTRVRRAEGGVVDRTIKMSAMCTPSRCATPARQGLTPLRPVTPMGVDLPEDTPSKIRARGAADCASIRRRQVGDGQIIMAVDRF